MGRPGVVNQRFVQAERRDVHFHLGEEKSMFMLAMCRTASEFYIQLELVPPCKFPLVVVK